MPRSENTSGPAWDIWLNEIARGVDSRFTVHPSRNFQPVWSPDGRRLLFTSNRAGPFGLYMKETNGSGQDELFLKGQHSRFATDWSRDGRLIMYVDTDPKNKWDLWTATVDGERKPVLFLQTEFNECQGQFSPDGKWVAYSSDESGRYEIYVRRFPPGPGKWKISIGGGEFPRWRRDGKELFFLSPELRMMSVTIKAVSGSNPRLEVTAPQVLFESHIAQVPAGFNNYNYAVAVDGKRFLVNTAGKEAADTPVTLVTNWLASVKR